MSTRRAPFFLWLFFVGKATFGFFDMTDRFCSTTNVHQGTDEENLPVSTKATSVARVQSACGKFVSKAYAIPDGATHIHVVKGTNGPGPHRYLMVTMAPSDVVIFSKEKLQRMLDRNENIMIAGGVTAVTPFVSR